MTKPTENHYSGSPEKRLPYLQASKKEFALLTTGRRQEKTDLNKTKNKQKQTTKKKTASFQVEVTEE